MNGTGLREDQLALIRDAIAAEPAVEEAVLYGSRAKGTHRPNSDIDIALVGELTSLAVAAIAERLDELPLPYTFDVQALANIRHAPLREHIERVGRSIYRR